MKSPNNRDIKRMLLLLVSIHSKLSRANKKNVSQNHISLSNYLITSITSITILIILTNISFSQTVNWVKIYPYSCYDINVLNDSSMFATAMDGVKYSSDSGQSWATKNPWNSGYKTEFAINSSTNSIFVPASNPNVIYKSTNMGNDWTESLAISGQITKIIEKDGVIYAIEYFGKFYKSTNDGVTWDSSFVASGSISIAVCSTKQIFIGMHGDEIYSSTDSGKTWTHLNDPQIDFYVYSIVVNDKDEIFATHHDGVIVSKDYGKSWNLLPAPIGLRNESTLVFDNMYNLYAGANSVIKSTNSGLDWTNLGGQFEIKGMSVCNNKIYLATYGGLYKYDPSIPIYVGSNYFPLHVGNVWQYLHYSVGIDIHHYSLNQMFIEKDTLINNISYYRYKDQWVRYSETEKKIFIRDKDSDRVFMDFTLPAMASFQQFTGTNTNSAVIFDGSQNMFGNSVKYKGYKRGDVWAFGQEKEWFCENIGPAEYSYACYAGPDVTYGDELIMAVIFDSTNTPTYWSKHNKPIITINSISPILTGSFSVDLSVGHSYSTFYDPASPHTGLNFIDSVYVESYYSRNASIVMKENIYAINTPKTNKYLVSSSIDTLLLKDGFTFNYKIIAKDKGIIPETSSSPDTGYYQIKWGTTSVDDIKHEAIGFNLGQNYPNPFNPSTVISWQLLISSFVTLKVYDMLGNEIAILVNEEMRPGQYHNKFETDRYKLASGIYFYQLRAGNLIETKKMIFLR